jgi:transcriptional regulator GlxA family with amidase domain
MSASAPFVLGVLALDDSVLTTLTGLLDPVTPPRFVAKLINARGHDHVTAANGLALHGLSPPDTPVDALLVPGFIYDNAASMRARLHQSDVELDYLCRQHARGVALAAACSGTFMLASTGLLDGGRATTCWWLDLSFRRAFPRVALDVEQLLVESNGLTTAGASTAILDYTLKLLADRVDPDLAAQVGRVMLLDGDRRSQAPYVTEALREKPRHSITERCEKYIKQHLEEPISLADLAAHCDTSERSLLRHFQDQYQTTPTAHIQTLRVERAKALLEATHLSFEEIVARCGYSDPASFRKLFKRATTLTPAEYRMRFRLRARA